MLGLLRCVWGFCMPAGLLSVFFSLYFLNDVASVPNRKYQIVHHRLEHQQFLVVCITDKAFGDGNVSSSDEQDAL